MKKLALFYVLGLSLAGYGSELTVSGLYKDSILSWEEMSAWSDVTMDDFCENSPTPDEAAILHKKMETLSNNLQNLYAHQKQAQKSFIIWSANALGYLSVEKTGSGVSRKLRSENPNCLSPILALDTIEKKMNEINKESRLQINLEESQKSNVYKISDVKSLALLIHYNKLAVNFLSSILNTEHRYSHLLQKVMAYSLNSIKMCNNKKVYIFVYGPSELHWANKKYVPDFKKLIQESSVKILPVTDFHSAWLRDRNVSITTRKIGGVSRVNYFSNESKACAEKMAENVIRSMEVENRIGSGIQIGKIPVRDNSYQDSIEIWLTPRY